MHKQAKTIRRLRTKTSSDTLQNEKASRLVDMPAEGKAEVKVDTVIDTLGNVEAYYCYNLAGKRYLGQISGLTLIETLQLGTNLVEKVFAIMPTFLRNKTFF